MKTLRILVIFMGVLLIVGTTTLVVLLLKRNTTPSTAPVEALTYTITDLPLTQEEQITHEWLASDHMVLKTNQNRYFIIKLKTGHIVTLIQP